MAEKDYASYQVSDADFEAAVKNASSFARQRVFKKMTKVCRTKRYDAVEKAILLDTRPPKDVEEYVKRFVWNNKDKHEEA
jgi:uncharacterized alpha/beta hydrolase family protein